MFKGRALDPEHPDVLTRIVEFALQVDSLCSLDLAPSVRTVLSEETQRLLDRQPINEFVSKAAANVANDPTCSLLTRAAVAKALVVTKTASVTDACSIIVDGGLNVRAASVETCQAALDTLNAFGDEAKTAQEKFELLVHEKFPLIVKSVEPMEDSGL